MLSRGLIGFLMSLSLLGNLERFVRYSVSVYPVFAGGWVGEPTSKEAYLEQGGKSTHLSVTHHQQNIVVFTSLWIL